MGCSFISRDNYNVYYGRILKEVLKMITLSVLLIALLVVAIVAALALLAGGAGLILTFGDLLVCGLIIVGLVKLFNRKK